jgi:glycolate oxidase iron-sulfur subunit
VLKYTRLNEPYPALGEAKGKLLFFTGCIQEGFLAGVNQATVRVLQRNGYEVIAPQGQTCCGAAHLHLGDKETARQLARQNIDTFMGTNGPAEAIICNAGGCGVSLKEYPHLLAEDADYAEKARSFSAKVKDVSEFLADHLSVPPQGEVPVRATYADSCHLRHAQKVAAQPRKLLKSVPGLQLVELAMPDRCCGSAGVYNIAQVETAEAILNDKIADIAATGAELIVTSNTGCYMHLMSGARRAGLKARVMHVMEVLDMSYQSNNEQQG